MVVKKLRQHDTLASLPVDFLKTAVSKGEMRKTRRKIFFVGKFFIYFIILLLIVSFTLAYRVMLSSNKITGLQGGIKGFFTQVSSLVTNQDKPLSGEDTDRINILLLGMGGEGHQGAYLTDTIILVSIRPQEKEVGLLSIPRDLYVPIPGYGWRKINEANAFGEMSKAADGTQLISQVISQVTGQTIDYYARLDFNGFTDIVDRIGGLTIDVDNSFTDYEYPTANFGYQTVSFVAGRQVMNGDKVLKYVRSRHGNNGEGSDFARSRRQQKVLLAFKQKVFSAETLLNPARISDILEALGNHVRTNFKPWEMLRLASLLKSLDSQKVVLKVLDDSPTGPLHADTTIDGAYILRTRTGDFSEIQYIASNIFSYGFIAKEDAKIEIQNGTAKEGLATTTAQSLRRQNFNIVTVSNAAARDYDKTVIYDLTLGHKPYTLMALRKELNANIATVIPEFLWSSANNKITSSDLNPALNINTNVSPTNTNDGAVDFIIVLGKNSSQSTQQTAKQSTKTTSQSSS